MPVVRHINNQTCPHGCTALAAGMFHIPIEGGRFDRHFHDSAEYWLICRGKAKVMSEGETYYVKPGDIVCTAAGDEHDVLEIYEELEAFFLEEALPNGGRRGHLYKNDEDAKGHGVPFKTIPPDFPE